ncbi:hypothetical protein VTJ49DRAFT_30 [Mycothermus thermophilus]|uniref:SprT-like domain-containing protein n=1 Tax=Humicola insolens TaxID=85995 RepID=A0ABR3VRR8_HUMIN
MTGGGHDYPPFRPSSAGPTYYSPIKRRPVEAIHASGNESDHGYYNLPQKRPRYDGPVAFRAVAAPLRVHSSPPVFPHYHLPPLKHHHLFPSPLPALPPSEPTATAIIPAPTMERTASGHSILPDPTEGCASTELLEDHEAAQRVRDHLAHFLRRNPDSKHERILRSIIFPRLRSDLEDEETAYPIDNAALESIFSAANEIFFNGRLSQRVAWDWSHASAERFDRRVIGTTALRRAAAKTRGYETLIVLSSPILRDPRYSRRLLISTFLHELIHCYLFICCGFRARGCGGHTPGFRDIAAVIDGWIGEGGGGLYLTRVEADLELFRVDRGREGRMVEEQQQPREVWTGKQERWSWGGRGGVGDGGVGVGGESAAATCYPCSGMAGPENDEYRDHLNAPPHPVHHHYHTHPVRPLKPEPVYIGLPGSGSGPTPGLGAVPTTNIHDAAAPQSYHNYHCSHNNHSHAYSSDPVVRTKSGGRLRSRSRSSSPAWHLRHHYRRTAGRPPPQPPTGSSFSSPSASASSFPSPTSSSAPYTSAERLFRLYSPLYPPKTTRADLDWVGAVKAVWAGITTEFTAETSPWRLGLEYPGANKIVFVLPRPPRGWTEEQLRELEKTNGCFDVITWNLDPAGVFNIQRSTTVDMGPAPRVTLYLRRIRSEADIVAWVGLVLCFVAWIGRHGCPLPSKNRITLLDDLQKGINTGAHLLGWAGGSQPYAAVQTLLESHRPWFSPKLPHPAGLVYEPWDRSVLDPEVVG